MKTLAALAVAFGCLTAAQTAAAQESTATSAISRAVYRVCVPLFDGQPTDSARLDRQAEEAGMVIHEGKRWSPNAPRGSAVMVTWEESGGCYVTLFGQPGSGDAFVESLTPTGWREQQQALSLEPGVTTDVWSGQPTTADHTLLVVASRWSDPDIAYNEPRMTVIVMRAP